MSDLCPKCGAEMTIYIDDVHPQAAHTTDSIECRLNQANARIARFRQQVAKLEAAEQEHVRTLSGGETEIRARDKKIAELEAEVERLRAIVDDLVSTGQRLLEELEHCDDACWCSPILPEDLETPDACEACQMHSAIKAAREAEKENRHGT